MARSRRVVSETSGFGQDWNAARDHLAVLPADFEADARLVGLYADPQAWARKAIWNVADALEK